MKLGGDNKYVAMAFEALFLNKVRSSLTMLGIIIGVFSVIVMVGLGEASQAYITNQVKGLGAGVLVVTPGNPKTQTAGPPGLFTAQTLTMDDVRAIENLPGIRFVSPNAFTQGILKVDRNTLSAMVLGTSPNIQGVRGIQVQEGRFYTDQEARSGAKVIVLGNKLARDLFDKVLVDPLSAKVRIDNQRFRIVGVLKAQEGGILGAGDDQAILPTRTFQTYLKHGNHLNSLFIKAENEELLSVLHEQVRGVLRSRHAIRADEEDDFKIQTQADLLSTITVVTNVFTFLLAGIASISLLVGGIGIMNIMLVSVTERTREIGVRKAVGAKKRDIMTQFLLEASALSLAGGALGIILGVSLTALLTKLAGIPYVFSPVAIAGSALFSAGIGLFFGLYPASRAAKLDPVEALRYE